MIPYQFARRLTLRKVKSISEAFVMIRAGIAGRVHMMLYMIRLSYVRKIYPVMADLGSLLLTGFLTQAAVLIYRWFLEAIA